MNIYTDLEILHPRKAESLPPQSSAALRTIIEFVEQRLSVLRCDMDAEEAFNPPMPPTGEMIFLISKKLSVCGYSKALEKKILDSFSDEDFVYMWEKTTYAYLNAGLS